MLTSIPLTLTSCQHSNTTFHIFVHDVKSAYQLPKYTRETIDNVRRSIAACNAFVARRAALSVIESIDDEGASWDASTAVLGRSFACP